MNIMVIAPCKTNNPLNEYTLLIQKTIKIMMKCHMDIDRTSIYACISSSHVVDDSVLYEALSYMGFN